MINLVVEKNPESLISDSYRMLMNNVECLLRKEKLKSIAVTSAEPNEGKTTVASNLAIELSKNGYSVVLVDCDLRKPQLNKIFNMENNKGICEIINNGVRIENEIVKYRDNMNLLFTGKDISNPCDKLLFKNVTKLIEGLEKKYDVVILDCPAVKAVSDAQTISAVSNAVILVVRANKTKRESVIEAKGILDKVKSRLIGIVLNDVNEEITNKYHSYYE